MQLLLLLCERDRMFTFYFIIFYIYYICSCVSGLCSLTKCCEFLNINMYLVVLLNYFSQCNRATLIICYYYVSNN